MRIFATMLRGFVLTFVFILKEYIIWKKMEKPRDFDPFGQTGLSPLATI